MFKGRSVTAFLAVLFASAYLVYLIISFKDFNNQSEEPAGQFIRALLTFRCSILKFIVFLNLTSG